MQRASWVLKFKPTQKVVPTSHSQMVNGLPGWYELMSGADRFARSSCIAHSTVDQPTEIYLAEGVDKLAQARPIASFNKLFTERNLPKGKPYRWTSDDGTSVEGMLIYPPGKVRKRRTYRCLY